MRRGSPGLEPRWVPPALTQIAQDLAGGVDVGKAGRAAARLPSSRLPIRRLGSSRFPKAPASASRRGELTVGRREERSPIESERKIGRVVSREPFAIRQVEEDRRGRVARFRGGGNTGKEIPGQKTVLLRKPAFSARLQQRIRKLEGPV